MAESSVTTTAIRLVDGAQYSFEYYQNAGELVGTYHFPYTLQEQIPFFRQNIHLANRLLFPITNGRRALNDTDAFLFLEVRNNGVEAALSESNLAYPAESDVSFKFGEFMLLTNDLRSISRINLAWDLTDSNFVARPGTPLLKPDVEHFLQFYVSYANVRPTDRPAEYDDRSRMPLVDDPVDGIQRLTWDSIRDTCFTAVPVFDGTDFQPLADRANTRHGQYVVRFELLVNRERLNQYIRTNCPVGIHYLMIYFPSMYMRPLNNIVSTISPRLYSFNNSFENITFEAPNNYKTDGNLQFLIEFYKSETSSELLYVTSSCIDSPHYESRQWQFMYAETLQWQYASEGTPTDNNEYIQGNGPNAKAVYRIRYNLSQPARDALSRSDHIVFKIKQLDGTVIFQSG